MTRQVTDCRAEAERRGWTVAEEYIDNDLSAYSGKRRPAYQRMLDDIADGLRDAVIVYHLDRLHRQPKELEEFAEVCDRAGMKHVATLAGDVNLGTGDGLLVARIMGAVAAQESATKARRVRRKLEELAEQGNTAAPTGRSATSPISSPSDPLRPTSSATSPSGCLPARASPR